MFEYDFMVNAFICGIIIAIISPIIGTFLVVRRYTLISDTLAHTSLTGVIFGFLFGISPIFSTLIYTVFTSFIIEKLRQTKNIMGDMVLSIILSLNLSIVAICLSFDNSFMYSINSYLFGSISLISNNDVIFLVFLSIFIISTFFFIREKLLRVTYDLNGAKASGINVNFINFVFVLLTSILITICLPIVGILLMGSLLILPVIVAIQISWSFFSTIVIAQGVSIFSVIFGLSISYFFDLSASGVITLTLLFLFFIFFWLGKIILKRNN